jgi:hypothetical protein
MASILKDADLLNKWTSFYGNQGLPVRPRSYRHGAEIVYEQATGDATDADEPTPTVPVTHVWTAGGQDQISFQHPLAVNRPEELDENHIRLQFIPSPKKVMLELIPKASPISTGPAIVRIEDAIEGVDSVITVHSVYYILPWELQAEKDQLISNTSFVFDACNIIYERSNKMIHTCAHVGVWHLGQAFEAIGVMMLTPTMLKRWQQAWEQLLHGHRPGPTESLWDCIIQRLGPKVDLLVELIVVVTLFQSVERPPRGKEYNELLNRIAVLRRLLTT